MGVITISPVAKTASPKQEATKKKAASAAKAKQPKAKTSPSITKAPANSQSSETISAESPAKITKAGAKSSAKTATPKTARATSSDGRVLVIVESPSKAATLSGMLGKGYVVKSSKGHMKDLPKSRMAIDIEHDFTP